MDKSNQLDPFGFLNGTRERAFVTAIDAANLFSDATASTKNHILERMPRLGKAASTRAWLIAHVRESLSDDDGAIPRSDGNIDGIEFDNTHFLYFRKIDDPELPPAESKTLRIARLQNMLYPEEYQQLELDDPLIEELPEQTPLSSLYHVMGGYIADNGRITELYFLDIDRRLEIVRDYRPLGLATSLIRPEREVTPVPKSTFTLKSEQDAARKARS